MKKTILTLAFASAIGVVAAQKPAAGTMGFTAGLANGITQGVTAGPSKTGSLQFKYYISEGMAARVGFNVTVPFGNGTTISDTIGKGAGSIGGQKTTVLSGGTKTAISLGIQKSLGGTDKLDVYTGADFFFGGTASSVKDVRNDVIYVPAAAASGPVRVGDYDQTVTTTAGGWNTGLFGLVGFQYFLVEKFSVGAEFNYGYSYASSNNSSGSTVVTSTANGVAATKAPGMTTSTPSSPNMHTGVHGIGVGGGTITMSFFF